MKTNIKKTILTIMIIVAAVLTACTAPTQDAEKQNQKIANPASEFCEKQGGKLDIVTAADGSQKGNCVFSDGTSCDEWAFFSGQCRQPTSGASGDSAASGSAPVNCQCPEGYLQEGDGCTPKCYYTTPKCAIPSRLCMGPDEIAAANNSTSKTTQESGSVGSETSGPASGSEPTLQTNCTEPRQEMCTMEYMPVCGYTMKQVYCIKAPCPPIPEGKTYGNKCQACADKNVAFWETGECAQ